MNYSPFLYQMPSSVMPLASTAAAARGGGLLSSLFGGMNFGSIVTNAGKTLGVINQAIPIVKQAGPVMKNAKTMFKVLNEFKRSDNIQPNSTNVSSPTSTTNNSQTAFVEKEPVNEISNNNEIKFDGSPVFFV